MSSQEKFLTTKILLSAASNSSVKQKNLQVPQRHSSEKFFHHKNAFSIRPRILFEQTPSRLKNFFSSPREYFTTENFVSAPIQFSSTAKQFQPFTIFQAPKNSSAPKNVLQFSLKFFSQYELSPTPNKFKQTTHLLQCQK